MQQFLFPYLRAPILVGLLLIAISNVALAKENTVLILGDSISAAYGMSLEEGWVALLARQIAETHPQHRVINASISGETTVGAPNRVDRLLEEHEPSVVVIELGGNDGLRGFPVSQLRENLEQLAQRSNQAGAQVVMVSIQIPPNYGTRYTTSFHESYALTAENRDSILTPFILDGIATNPDLMQADGIHPKAEAQPDMLRNMLPYIEKALQ
ncbi:arylesterase [Marinobacter alexandrii]|uniref:arylesterase n=1 Tax=Marinobacter alexandrii TaxID=2570351 RepID=UPI003297B2CE